MCVTKERELETERIREKNEMETEMQKDELMQCLYHQEIVLKKEDKKRNPALVKKIHD